MITKKGLRTKERITQSATELFASKSISTTTISEITIHANIGKGTFYSYFESKDELIWHIIENETMKFFSIFNRHMNSNYYSEDIDNVIDSLINYITENQHTLKIVNNPRFYNYLDRKKIVDKYYQQYGVAEPIYKWLKRGKELGQLEIRDINFTALFFTNVVDQMITQILLDQLPYTLDELNNNLKDLSKRVLGIKIGG